MSGLAATLQRAAEWLQPYREGLLSSVAHRIAPIREPEELMQQAADDARLYEAARKSRK
jgi:hypothetical protein